METTKEFAVRAAPDYIKRGKKSHNQSDIVFFRVNVQELFNIDLNYRGIRTCLNRAFESCKQYIPYDSGLTYRSFTPKILNDSTVEYFFDPSKIVGQMRKGKRDKEARLVTDYYVVYIAETTKNFSWLTKVIYEFYETLFREVSKLKKAKEQINKAKQKIYEERLASKQTTTNKVDRVQPPTIEQEPDIYSAKTFLEQVRDEFEQKVFEQERQKRIQSEVKRANLENRMKGRK